MDPATNPPPATSPAPDPPLAGDELATLLGTLERNRATFAWKCGGLDAAGLTMTVGASPITLGGLLKHVAYVEDYWFGQFLRGEPVGAPWNSVDWAADPDWDWHSAAADSPEELAALWRDAVRRARAHVAAALTEGGLDQLSQRSWPDGKRPNLRRILVDMIEEYARHTGHADLLRETVDGSTGEGSPTAHPPYPPLTA